MTWLIQVPRIVPEAFYLICVECLLTGRAEGSVVNTPNVAGVTRRALLGRASLLAIPGLVGCATMGSGQRSEDEDRGEKSLTNPFGVPTASPLDVVIFKGGFGDDYAKVHEGMYTAKYPQARIGHQGIQKINEVLQPRFNAGNPPDVIDDSGASMIQLDTLLADGQLEDLTPLLDAPSLDDPNVPVRDTLREGVIESGTYDGTMYVLNYSFMVSGLWYSNRLFAQHSWRYPTDWDEFLSLCEAIRSAGIAPWAHQGKYPGYMVAAIMDLAAINGGLDLQRRIDNLEQQAWRDPAVFQAVNGFHQLVLRGLCLPGTEGMTHTEAQTAWCQGKAAFIPCGSWLENEQWEQIPAGFDLAVGAIPPMTGASLPFGSIRAGADESFVVPAKARNKAGGMEYLRIMVSREGSRRFTELTRSLSVVKDTTPSNPSPGLASALGLYERARDQAVLLTWRSPKWYSTLAAELDNATGELMAGRLAPEEWIDRVQRAADRVARDPSIKKYVRT